METDYFSKVRFKIAFVMPLKIVPLHYCSSLPVVCGSEIWLENLQTLAMRAQPLLRDLSLILAVDY